MPNSRLIFFVFFMLSLLPLRAAADVSGQYLVESLDADLRTLVAEGDVPGLAVAVIWRGEPLLMRGYGVTAAGGSPVDTESRFRIASLSKGFASTAAALLVQDGYYGWDDPVQRFLPDFTLKDAEGASRFSVAQVLSHSAGLPPNAYDNLLEAGIEVDVILRRLAEVDLLCPVGSCHTYQNVLFSLIAPVMELTSGHSFEQLVHERLLAPLGMRHAGFGLEHLTGDENWARPHVNTRRAGLVPTRVTADYYRVAPAAGVNASIQDMLLWLHAQMGYRDDVVSADVLSSLHTPNVRTRGELRRPEWRRQRLRDAHYGLGWRIYDYAGHQAVYHGGAVLGYRAQMAFLPQHELGMVVLWNSNSQRPWGLAPTLFDRFLGLPERDWMDVGAGKRSLASEAQEPQRQGSE